ncbi:ATPase [Sulfurifustis variabilis]|uniref:tRNA threonylcarbamoyladenosine biosynthesis protein TsaE n=1 Tax=Sulfurifustis variabilis TaxID=1675686 RepID=A0A1B4VBN9_9GAMM|nr:tRNA (adenosine(37)-N6)-threonylcarbamoyltransferase complex ATPase subunit type 1 TsaE [Sulfurifustis variabilis]BAU48171.1 ATPase [Sulfurifustis variabilis]
MSTVSLHLADEAATERLGARLAAALPGIRLVYVRGPLGAGKTTLVRGMLRALGHEGPVKSPTFTLVEPYALDGYRLHHFDLYRLENPKELEFLGMRDYLQGNDVCVVEWPERAGGVLPPPDLDVMILLNNNRGRSVHLEAHTQAGEALLGELR